VRRRPGQIKQWRDCDVSAFVGLNRGLDRSLIIADFGFRRAALALRAEESSACRFDLLHRTA
jgi:hypothetical protein